MDIDPQTPAASPRAIYLKDYQAPKYSVEHVDMHFNLSAAQTQVISVLKLKRNPDIKEQLPMILDGHGLELVSIKLDGTSLTEQAYQLTEETLTIAEVPEQFELSIETLIQPDRNKALEGLYASATLLCTQCEAEGFRRITYFPDRPDVMTTFTVTLQADKTDYPVLLANGNLVAQGEDEAGRHWTRWEDPSLKPSYLFAIVAGQLVYREAMFITCSGREVVLRIYVEKENQHKCDFAMACLKQAMKWDEETYGREYDLDIFMIVAVNDFNMGAMENKGLNIFNASCVLASPETATDADFYNIQSIIGHEYFHNWSGNRVTCRDWFQLSLKEGFTVFRDQQFSADLNSRAVKRIDDVNVLRVHQFAQDAGPMAHPIRPDHFIEISNFYTVTVYNKGAEVVRMLHNLVGGEGFRRGTDLYFSRHDGQAVTTDDFVKAIEDANDRDFAQFRNWYSQAGTPVITVSDEYDTAAKTCTIRFQQSCPVTPGQEIKQPFHIPVQFGLLGSKGNDIPLQLEGETQAPKNNRLLELTESEHTFRFINITEPPILSILRSFSAPVKVNKDYRDDELALLMAYDNDEFNRWDAAQSLALRVLLSLIIDVQNNRPLIINEFVMQAFEKVLSDTDADEALTSQIMTLPSESYIADQYEVVDVDAIHVARKFFRQTLAGNLEQKFLARYQSYHNNEAYQFNAEAMGKRSLKNLCLGYLMCLQQEQYQKICYEQFVNASNMTDQMAAISLLTHYDCVYRKKALQEFYQQWQADQQVVEKWFALQAVSELPEALHRVKQLMQHPVFSMQNPNKVRALIGRFCAGNLVQFHAINGEGYAFLADQVLELNDTNPQIAARLIQIMIRWRRYDKIRQSLMKQQLQNIRAHKNLSRDVYEVVSKALEN